MNRNNHAGVVELLGELQEIARGAVESQLRPWADFGTVNADGSLQLDRFAPVIPAGGWLRARFDTLADPMVTTSSASGHTHNVPRPAALAPLGAGDRVAVLWLLDWTQPVVLFAVEG